jgi:methylthioribose-1-phosphate isomerase
LQLNLQNLPRTIWWEVDQSTGLAGVCLIDQTRLPLVGDVLQCQTLAGVEQAIESLAVRGAPALGVAAALAIAVWSHNESQEQDAVSYQKALVAAAQRISAVRPTAVNLSWGAARVIDFSDRLIQDNPDLSIKQIKNSTEEFAVSLINADETVNRAIGKNGASLIAPSSNIMTICNAGSLATAYYGTALGVVYSAAAENKIEHVWSCETRPVGQGARLTVWELMTVGIPCTLIADAMAASFMANGWVDAVLVGADRIAANGDTANKIGTLNLAILADYFKIPFYVCAPRSTIDLNIANGSEIKIEHRDPRELSGFNASGIILPKDEQQQKALDMLTVNGQTILDFKHGAQMQLERKGAAYSLDAWFAQVPPNTSVYNPAFDVTPAKLITAIITDQDIFRAPFNLK